MEKVRNKKWKNFSIEQNEKYFYRKGWNGRFRRILSGKSQYFISFLSMPDSEENSIFQNTQWYRYSCCFQQFQRILSFLHIQNCNYLIESKIITARWMKWFIVGHVGIQYARIRLLISPNIKATLLTTISLLNSLLQPVRYINFASLKVKIDLLLFY